MISWERLEERKIKTFNSQPCVSLLTSVYMIVQIFLQLKVVAYDSGRENLRTTATVIITVNRNLNGPRVNPPSSVIDVEEDENPQKWHYPVNVTDPDSVSQYYNCFFFFLFFLIITAAERKQLDKQFLVIISILIIFLSVLRL